MTPKAFGRVAGIACLFVLLFAGACRAQSNPLNLGGVTAAWSGLQLSDSLGHPIAIAFKELSGYAGVTICWQGRPYAFLATSLTGIEEAEVRAHEAKHVEQMGRLDNDCAKFADWYRTPVGKLESEAEAYAAGLCKWVELGGDPISRRRSIRASLEAGLGTANLLSAILAVERFAAAQGCGLKP